MENITAAEIRTGDTIRTAAMRQPEVVRSVGLSSTGRTVEISTDHLTYRVGLNSKVKRYGA